MSELRFKFGNEDLPFPSLASLNFRDAIVINRLTGMSLADFADQSNETKIAGLIAVALQRAHPDWLVNTVAEMVLDADLGGWELYGGREDASAPPLSATPKPDETSESPDSEDNANESDGPSV